MGLELLWLILAVLFGGYVFLFGFLKRFNEWYYVSGLGKTQYPLPPGDMGWPYLGSVSTFLKALKFNDPDSFIYNLVSKHGRTGTYKTYMFGSPCVIVCIPEISRNILMDDERFKVSYPKATTILASGRSLHGSSNAEHKSVRTLITSPIKGHKALAGYIELIEGIVSNSLEEWASMKCPIDFLTELQAVTFKVITNIFISTYSESVLSSVENMYTDLIAGLMSPAINLPGFAFHTAIKARKKLAKIFQNILDKKKAIIRNHFDSMEAQKDMMDLLLEIKDEDGRQLEDEDIVDLLIVLILAGHETSALGTLWAVIYLSQNPNCFSKAKEEQQEIMKRRPPTQMEYLSKVIDEMLRITNMVFSIFREAKEDVNINGYFIPKGWKVLVWSKAIHMDPKTYSNPRDFNPERWNNFRPKAGSFLPFGAGSRHCPGSDLAKREISIFLHHYLLNYDIKRLNPDCPIKWLPIPRPTNNCLAKIIKVN